MKPHPVILALAALSATAALSFAQSTSADIVGTVRDSADAVMPNITIRLWEENTNFSRQTVSNQEGIYEFRILSNGFIGGWAVAGLVDAKSGRPDTVVFTGKDTSNTKSAPYLDLACFAVPQNGTFGDAGLSPFRDPGMYGVTGTLYKYFPLFRERARLRINAIFANAFNHPVWNTVGNNISQPATFGKLLINSANPVEYGGAARNIMLQAQVKS